MPLNQQNLPIAEKLGGLIYGKANNRVNIINYRFLTTETKVKALYIFCCLFTTSSVKLFVVIVQMFVYRCVFQKKEKQHSPNLSHFENESTIQKRTTFWKQKLLPKNILKMKTCFWKSEK